MCAMERRAIHVRKELALYANSPKPIYLHYRARGISLGGTVIDTTGNDKQKSTSSVFKDGGREGGREGGCV